MPWSGKSSMGLMLAKLLARPFLDTDIVIQAGENRTLQTIIDQEGADTLQHLEEHYVLGLTCRSHIIATGGSVVYSDAAINHLKKNGCCVYLQVPLSELEGRTTDIAYRGLVRAPGQGMVELYAERTPLYEHYADIVVHCAAMNQAQVLDKLIKELDIKL
ncbi:MAG: shikimate kinase [Candidatus Hydrogenedentes bacterium]|nr:shikimate kinase [Candidatus Hydrogenedentota bacterium]